jgi:hypothetical protein
MLDRRRKTLDKSHSSCRGLTVSYRGKERVEAFKTCAPDHALETHRELSVWDKLESFEDTYAHLRYKTKEHAII